MSKNNKVKGKLYRMCNFRKWKSGKQWFFSSSVKSKLASFSAKSVLEIKDDHSDFTAYQQNYGNEEVDPSVRRQLRLIGGLAAGLGLNILGGGLAQTASANTADLPPEKQRGEEALQHSVGIPLTDSGSTQVDPSLSLSESESVSTSASDLESTSESASHSEKSQTSATEKTEGSETASKDQEVSDSPVQEQESRVGMGTMATDGWNGNVWTLTIRPGDITDTRGGKDYSNASGTITITLNSDGTITLAGSLTNITHSRYGYTQFGGSTVSGLIVKGQVIDGNVSASKVLTAAQANQLYALVRGGSFDIGIDDATATSYGDAWIMRYRTTADMSPVLDFSTSLSEASMSESVSESASESAVESASESASDSSSTSAVESASESASDLMSRLESQSISGSALESSFESASELASQVESQSLEGSYLESMIDSIEFSESIRESQLESGSSSASTA